MQQTSEGFAASQPKSLQHSQVNWNASNDFIISTNSISNEPWQQSSARPRSFGGSSSRTGASSRLTFTADTQFNTTNNSSNNSGNQDQSPRQPAPQQHSQYPHIQLSHSASVFVNHCITPALTPTTKSTKLRGHSSTYLTPIPTPSVNITTTTTSIATQPQMPPSLPSTPSPLLPPSSTSPKGSPPIPYIRLGKWVSNVVGVPEVEFRKGAHCPFVPGQGEGYLELINQKTQESIDCGLWQIYSLEKLLQAAKEPCNKTNHSSPYGIAPPKYGTNYESAHAIFEIITRDDEESVKFVDIAYLQSLPRNAVFQVASNFNAVESDSEETGLDYGNFVTDYCKDRTQGPTAAIGAPGAALARVYMPFYKFGVDITQSNWHEFRQTRDKQIEMLEHLAKHYPTCNGYVVWTGTEPPLNKETLQKYFLSVQIGYHKDVQVVYGRRSPDKQMIECLPLTPKHHIDQIFCAAVNLRQGSSGSTNDTMPDAESRAKLILQSIYHSTYLAAIVNGRKHLYLTLVGAGAFGNDLATVYAAILSAHIRWANHPMSRLEKVTLVLYDPGLVSHPFLSTLRREKLPCQYILYSQGHPNLIPIPSDQTSSDRQTQQ